MTDDVGSYPPRMPPPFTDRLECREEDAVSLVVEIFEEKRSTGLDVPCYPQLVDMVEQFSGDLDDPDKWEEPYVLSAEEARIPELQVLGEYYSGGVRAKAALTGPVELAVSEFGPSPHRDVLLSLAETVKRFGEAAASTAGLDVAVISIDEPSLGTNPSLSVGEEDVVEALELASSADVETQVHLHSPLFYEETLEAGIDVVGVETASDPSRAEALDPEVLESYGAHLRAGVSRTDADSMAAEFRDRTGINVWTEEEGFVEMVERSESPETVSGRFEELLEQFGDRLRYVGPDCGLGGFPSREAAKKLLENTVEGVGRNRGERS